MMQRFEASADCVIRDALQSLTDEAPVAENHKLLYNWMKRHVESKASYYQGPILGESKSDLRRNLEPYGGLAKMLYRIGDNLFDIITGEKDPLELMLQNKLLDDIYREDSFYRCNLQLANFITLLSHKKPDMKVLEIGAGTGASTAAIFDTLQVQQPMKQPGGFQQYDFTDISIGFFERAQEEFKPWNHLVQFKKFDVESSPAEQGFEEGSYDLIIASNVLHATKSIDNTLANVKRLLSPKGKLALVELTHDSLTMGLIFGCFSGWWNGMTPLTTSFTY
jgi:ubiquinone/menaquinone biosynthesis C-methylase UbiE